MLQNKCFIHLCQIMTKQILSKVVEFCSNGNTKDALSYFENIYENQTSILLIRMFVNHFKLIERIFVTY